MLLAIDLGNTTTVFGLFADGDLKQYFEAYTDVRQTKDTLAVLLGNLLTEAGIPKHDITSAVISCVVPTQLPVVRDMIRSYYAVEPLVIGPGVKTGLNIRFSHPQEMGANRIATSVAAYQRYGGPVLVVDFGTATTFDAIDENGSYLGGAIAPGIYPSIQALFERAARLYWVDLAVPKSAIGKNTSASLQSGIVYGFAGMVDGMVERIKSEWRRDAIVVATGSYIHIMKRVCKQINAVDELLTLRGLEIIFQRNSG